MLAIQLSADRICTGAPAAGAGGAAQPRGRHTLVQRQLVGVRVVFEHSGDFVCEQRGAESQEKGWLLIASVVARGVRGEPAVDVDGPPDGFVRDWVVGCAVQELAAISTHAIVQRLGAKCLAFGEILTQQQSVVSTYVRQSPV